MGEWVKIWELGVCARTKLPEVYDVNHDSGALNGWGLLLIGLWLIQWMLIWLGIGLWIQWSLPIFLYPEILEQYCGVHIPGLERLFDRYEDYDSGALNGWVLPVCSCV